MSRGEETVIGIQDPYRPGEVGHLIVENADFWQRPNFEGRKNRFHQQKREFNIYIPESAVKSLQAIGYPVKTLDPRTEEEEPLHFMKIAVDLIPSKTEPKNPELESGADIWLLRGDIKQKLNSTNVAILDSTKAIDRVDMELRAWEYDREEAPGKYSARLVTLVAVMRPNRLADRYSLLT